MEPSRRTIVMYVDIYSRYDEGNPEMGMDNRSRERERERVQSSVSGETITDRSLDINVESMAR